MKDGVAAAIEIWCWGPESGHFVTDEGAVPLVLILTEEFVASPDRMAGRKAEARQAMQEPWDEATRARAPIPMSGLPAAVSRCGRAQKSSRWGERLRIWLA